MHESSLAFEVVPFPTIREAAIDLLRVSHNKHMIHGLFEVDVTDARQFIRAHKSRTGERLSFTAFVAYCLARAVAETRGMNAYRLGRKRLVIFDDVDVNTMVEREVDGHKMGTPNIIRAADKKTLRQIHDEIRSAQTGKVEVAKGMHWFKWASLFARLPTLVRMLVWRVMSRNPHTIKRFAGTVGLTAVGMFGRRLGWGMTIPLLTTNVVVGGISSRTVLAESGPEMREFLCLTVSVDHDIVDGAPAARFVNALAELIECGHGLTGGPASQDDGLAQA